MIPQRFSDGIRPAMGGGLSGEIESPGAASQKKPPKSLHCAASHKPGPATEYPNVHTSIYVY